MKSSEGAWVYLFKTRTTIESISWKCCISLSFNITPISILSHFLTSLPFHPLPSLSPSPHPSLTRHTGIVRCPLCSKEIASSELEIHLLACMTKPRVMYNGKERVVCPGSLFSCDAACNYIVHVPPKVVWKVFENHFPRVWSSLEGVYKLH